MKSLKTIFSTIPVFLILSNLSFAQDSCLVHEWENPHIFKLLTQSFQQMVSKAYLERISSDLTGV